jgi:hypothetical protein
MTMMSSKPELILPNIRYHVIDGRVDPYRQKRDKDMFMTCFGPTGCFLVGFMQDRKLWRLRSEAGMGASGYYRNWPWNNPSVAYRSYMEFGWSPRYYGVYLRDPSCDGREHIGKCMFFKKRGKRSYDDIYAGFIEDVTFLLIRLQRWSKRMIRTRRRLALCMGMHARLGDKCLLASLGEDVIQLLLMVNCHHY